MILNFAMALTAFLTPTGDAPKTFRQVDVAGLENVFQLPGDVYSGGEPASQAAFEQLRQLGVKTIVSVDGARPDVDAARRLGIRYVHIPIGYDGVDKEAAAKLKQVRITIDGPVYVHCHHGKHRGPAATCVLLSIRKDWSEADARSFLAAAGTANRYRGLWRDAIARRGVAPGGELIESAKIAPIAEVMARLDRDLDALANLQTPPTERIHKALLVEEAFVEMERELDSTTADEAEYRALLKNAHRDARRLRYALELNQERPSDASSNIDTAPIIMSLKNRCDACHKVHRDTAKHDEHRVRK